MITGILTDYALITEGEFTGYYGARIDDKPYVVLHHVDAFLLRLSKGDRVEVTLNKDARISKIMRAKAAPLTNGTKPKEQIDKEREEYNQKAAGTPTGKHGETDIAGDAVDKAKLKANGFGDPTPVPVNAPEGGIEGIVAAIKVNAAKQEEKSLCTSPSTPAKVAPKNYSEDEMLLLRNVIAKGCTEPEFKLLMYMANTYGLDPLLKQIWAVKRSENAPALIFAGRDGFLAVAHRSGQFDGLHSGVVYEGEGKEKKPVSAWCEIWRKDMSHSFKTEVPFAEYNTGMSVWKSNPSAMIIKVAEAVCLRKAFSVSGLYSPEEIS